MDSWEELVKLESQTEEEHLAIKAKIEESGTTALKVIADSESGSQVCQDPLHYRQQNFRKLSQQQVVIN